MKELNINGKIFHFIPYDEWGRSWDCIYEISVDSTLKEMVHRKIEPIPDFGDVRFYGIGGFKGLVSVECATEDNGFFDLEEQLEAAKLGCNIFYEYLK